MRYFAVIDTNVIIAALLSKNTDAATIRVMNAINDGIIIPLYHDDILDEYDDVLHRGKFHFQEDIIAKWIWVIKAYGMKIEPFPSNEILPDMDDLVFYEVALTKREDNAYLVTGNTKHYPVRSFIVTPAEMMEIIESR